MINGLLGRKIGMTQIFDEKGTVLPVTVLKMGPVTVVQKKTKELEGYDSVQVGFEEAKDKHTTKPLKGHFKSVKPHKTLQEFRVEDPSQFEVGQQIDHSIFTEGQMVSVTGTSKGKGFTGVVKRYGFAGYPASHGHRGKRGPGSIGQCATPGRVFKGKKMPGQHGNKRVTVLGLQIVKIIPEEQLVLVKGAVPGRNGGLITLNKQ